MFLLLKVYSPAESLSAKFNPESHFHGQIRNYKLRKQCFMIESFARHFARAWATSCSNSKWTLLKNNNNTERLEALRKSK